MVVVVGPGVGVAVGVGAGVPAQVAASATEPALQEEQVSVPPE